MFFSVLCLICLCTRLFICALWSPAGKGLVSEPFAAIFLFMRAVDGLHWDKRSKFNFSEHGHVEYKIKWNHKTQQHGSKYFARRPHP